MDLFINDLEKYAPVYSGGYAYGVAEKGMLVWSAPRSAWDIINNRLFSKLGKQQLDLIGHRQVLLKAIKFGKK